MRESERLCNYDYIWNSLISFNQNCPVVTLLLVSVRSRRGCRDWVSNYFAFCTVSAHYHTELFCFFALCVIHLCLCLLVFKWVRMQNWTFWIMHEENGMSVFEQMQTHGRCFMLFMTNSSFVTLYSGSAKVSWQTLNFIF